jgi:hypothetical protein
VQYYGNVSTRCDALYWSGCTGFTIFCYVMVILAGIIIVGGAIWASIYLAKLTYGKYCARCMIRSATKKQCVAIGNAML